LSIGIHWPLRAGDVRPDPVVTMHLHP